jgi:hypothetical protein
MHNYTIKTSSSLFLTRPITLFLTVNQTFLTKTKMNSGLTCRLYVLCLCFSIKDDRPTIDSNLSVKKAYFPIMQTLFSLPTICTIGHLFSIIWEMFMSQEIIIL